MAVRERNTLKSWFQTGDYPTQEQFWDWLDSFIHKTEDPVSIDNIASLRSLLDSKADFETVNVMYQQLQTLLAGSQRIYRLDVTAPLTDEYLNEQYPDAKQGTRVICPMIIVGGEVYEKYDDNTNSWFRLYMTKGTGNNPGIVASVDMEVYV